VSNAVPTWLDRFFLDRDVEDHGAPIAKRGTVDFEGAGVTVADDPTNGRTVITIPGGGSIPITVAYNGIGVSPVLKYVDSTSTLRTILSLGSGDQLTFGHGLIDLAIFGYSLQALFPHNPSALQHVGLTLHALGAGADGIEFATDGSVRLLRAQRARLEEKAADYTLVAGQDFHIVAIAGLTTATLPAAAGVADGDTFEVSNMSGGNIVVSGNGTNIYGVGANETLVDAEVAVYRFNSGAVSTTPNWIRVA